MRHYQSILLVTSNYHLLRSVNEFEELMPGLNITPVPVISDDFNIDNWWQNAESRRLLLSEYHKYLASELRHWFVSVVRHP